MGKGKTMSRKVFNNLARGAGIAAVLAMSSVAAQATTKIKIAAAANLTIPLQDIMAAFTAAYPGYEFHTTKFDSSGALEAEINGTCSGCTGPNQAGYDLFLAADTSHPQNLIDFSGGGLVYPYASGKKMFHYVIGRLVLYSNTMNVDVSLGLPAGWDACSGCTAIATPSAAPYGEAARQVLKNVYGLDPLDANIAQFSNITNTFNAVETGSVPQGFVARSQVCTHGDTTPVYTGVSHQLIASGPSTYDEILQGGVMLVNPSRGAPEQAELDAFVQFLVGKNFAGSSVTPNALQKVQYYCYDQVSNPYP
jgi:molybdate transport system substrate-binding protein